MPFEADFTSWLSSCCLSSSPSYSSFSGNLPASWPFCLSLVPFRKVLGGRGEREEEEDVKFKWRPVWQQEKIDNAEWLEIFFFIICRFKLSIPCPVLISMASQGLAGMAIFTTWQVMQQTALQVLTYVLCWWSFQRLKKKKKKSKYNPKNCHCKHGLLNVTYHPWLHE